MNEMPWFFKIFNQKMFRKEKRMREILFRGRCENGKWEYGKLAFEQGKLVIVINGEKESFYVQPETFGEFTGITDFCADKIYEGDIIKIADELFLVEWSSENAKFILSGANRQVDFGYVDDGLECEIVGNIHDNAELLDVQSD